MVKLISRNNPLSMPRVYVYCAGLGPSDSQRPAKRARPLGTLIGSGTIMKKVAVTALVLALGLAACKSNNADNNVANDTAVENNAEADVNAASTDATNAADAALNVADNAVENAGNAVDNAQAAVENK